MARKPHSVAHSPTKARVVGSHARPSLLVLVFVFFPARSSPSPSTNPVPLRLRRPISAANRRTEPWRRSSQRHCWHRANRRRALLRSAW
ncbi:hypothetical protein VPH35_051836 [Triticum aestivum]